MKKINNLIGTSNYKKLSVKDRKEYFIKSNRNQ